MAFLGVLGHTAHIRAHPIDISQCLKPPPWGAKQRGRTKIGKVLRASRSAFLLVLGHMAHIRAHLYYVSRCFEPLNGVPKLGGELKIRKLLHAIRSTLLDVLNYQGSSARRFSLFRATRLISGLIRPTFLNVLSLSMGCRTKRRD